MSDSDKTSNVVTLGGGKVKAPKGRVRKDLVALPCIPHVTLVDGHVTIAYLHASIYEDAKDIEIFRDGEDVRILNKDGECNFGAGEDFIIVDRTMGTKYLMLVTRNEDDDGVFVARRFSPPQVVPFTSVT